jgi:hypothetical protein
MHEGGGEERGERGEERRGREQGRGRERGKERERGRGGERKGEGGVTHLGTAIPYTALLDTYCDY